MIRGVIFTLLCIAPLFQSVTLQSPHTESQVYLPSSSTGSTLVSQPSTTLQDDQNQITQNNPFTTLGSSTLPQTEDRYSTKSDEDSPSIFQSKTTSPSKIYPPVSENISAPIGTSIQDPLETSPRLQQPTTTEDYVYYDDIDEITPEQREHERSLECKERERQFQDLKLKPINYLFYFLYFLLFVIGLSGNSLTVRAMAKKRKKSNIDLFILSLAMNDILICMFNIPITPLYTLYYQRWIFGCILCYVFTFAMCFSTYSSVFTLIAIAMVRYQMVVYPHCRWMTRRLVLGIIGFVSMLGISLTSPYMFNINMTSDYCGNFYCNELWTTAGSKFTFSLLTLLAKSVLPSVVVFFSYAAIYRKLKFRQRLHERRKALLTIAYPGAFPIVKTINSNHIHANALPASNTVPYELNAIQKQQQLDKRLMMNGVTRGAESLNNNIPNYLEESTSFNDKQILPDGIIDKYNSLSDMASDLGQVFGDPFELCTLLARKNSTDPTLNHLPSARIQHQTTALVDGLVDGFVVHSTGEQTPKRPATSLGFLNKVVSATNLFKNDQLVKSTDECQVHLKTNTILAIRENQIREKNLRMYQTSRKLVIVVALFVGCYLPVDLINVVHDYGMYMDTVRKTKDSHINSFYFLAAHLVNCASVCINPILYAWMSDNYRQELKNILPGWLTKRLFRDKE